MLNGLCTYPVIKIEEVKNEIYFAPCYVGIKTKKSILIKNLSQLIHNQFEEGELRKITGEGLTKKCTAFGKITFILDVYHSNDNHHIIYIKKSQEKKIYERLFINLKRLWKE